MSSPLTALSLKVLIDFSHSISFSHDFLISFTQSMIGEKRVLTPWVGSEGIFQVRVRISVLVTVASSTFFVATVSLDQFVYFSDNAVQALPHVGPHPVLKKA